MFDLNLGRVGLNPRPDFQPGQEARPLDLVQHDGSLWICAQPTLEQPSEQHPAWMLAVRNAVFAPGPGLQVDGQGAVSVLLRTGGGLGVDASGALGLAPETLSQELAGALAGILGAPQQLAQNTTFYVRSDGNDANTGLADTPTGAFKTPGAALNAIVSRYIFGPHTVTLRIGEGTFPRFTCPPYQAATGRLVIRGSGPGTVIAAQNVWAAVACDSNAGVYTLQDMTLSQTVTVPSSTTRNCLVVMEGCRVTLSGISCVIHEHAANTSWVSGIQCHGSHLTMQDGMDFSMNGLDSGSRIRMLYVEYGGKMFMNKDIDVSGRVDVTLYVPTMGYFHRFAPCIFTGALESGARYYVSYNGICQTSGGGPDFFPGTTAGQSVYGGAYY